MRVILGRLAIEKVISLWDIVTQNDETLDKCFSIIEQRVIINPDIANSELEHLWSHCDSLLWKNESDSSPLMVGYGAIQLARESIFGPFVCDKLRKETLDADIETSLNDASFFAATAFTGGAPWDDSGDSSKRLQFWNWWLNQASSYVGRNSASM